MTLKKKTHSIDDRLGMWLVIMAIGLLFWLVGHGLEWLVPTRGAILWLVGLKLEEGGIATMAMFGAGALAFGLGRLASPLRISDLWPTRIILACALIIFTDLMGMMIVAAAIQPEITSPWFTAFLTIGGIGLALGILVAPFLRGAIVEK